MHYLVFGGKLLNSEVVAANLLRLLLTALTLFIVTSTWPLLVAAEVMDPFLGRGRFKLPRIGGSTGAQACIRCMSDNLYSPMYTHEDRLFYDTVLLKKKCSKGTKYIALHVLQRKIKQFIAKLIAQPIDS